MSGDDEDDQPPWWRRSVARAFYVSGALLVALPLLRTAPHDQVLVFRLAHADAAGRLRVSWTPAGEREPSGGAVIAIEHPEQRVTALRSIRHSVSLRDGEYTIAVSVEPSATGSPDETTEEHRVTLSGGETVIAVQDERTESRESPTR